MPEPSKPVAPHHAQFSGFKKPVQRSGWEGFKHFIWDSDNSAFLGRTASSWGKIVLFYVIYYAILAGVWSFMLWVFLQTTTLEEPKWQQEESIIGVNPGVAFRPAPPVANIDSTLIHFSEGQGGTWDHWVSELRRIVDEMAEEEAGVTYVDCDGPSDVQKKPHEVCRINVNQFGPHCSKNNSFGYAGGKPCIFIKLNKIYGWVPPVFEHMDELPDEMPDYLKKEIKEKYANGTNHITRKSIWLSCQGENAADKENIGELEITPYPGIPAAYYPFKRQPGYKSPMVAIQFKRPEPAVLINIECKAWFKGVVHNRRDRVGSVHFELLVD